MTYRPVTARQHAAILTGLRLYQALQDGDLNAQRMSDVMDIASDSGTLRPLTADETEILCERLQS